MKRSIFLFALCALALLGCEDKSSIEYIKGHTFATDGKSIIEISFKNDMRVIYTWKNTWEDKSNERNDLIYTIDTDTTFSIFETKNDAEWANGIYHCGAKPFITLSNFKGDTLYLK